MRKSILAVFLVCCGSASAQSGKLEQFIDKNILDPALKNAGIDPASSDAVNAKRLGFRWLSPSSTDAEIQDAIDHIKKDAVSQRPSIDSAPTSHALACSMMSCLQKCGCDRCIKVLFAGDVAIVVLDYDTGEPMKDVNVDVQYEVTPRNYSGAGAPTDADGFVSFPAGNWKDYRQGKLMLGDHEEPQMKVLDAGRVGSGLYFVAVRKGGSTATLSRDYRELAWLCRWNRKSSSVGSSGDGEPKRSCCGQKYAPGDAFCSTCGKALAGGVEPTDESPPCVTTTVSREQDSLHTIPIPDTEFELGILFGMGVGVYFRKRGEDWQGTTHLGVNLQGYLGDSDRYSAAADQPRSGFENAAGQGADGRSVTRDPLLAGSAYTDSECGGPSRKFLAVSTGQQPVWYDDGDILLMEQKDENLYLTRNRTALRYERGSASLKVTITQWKGEVSRSVRTAQVYPGTECGVFPQEVTVVVEVLSR